MIFVIVRFIILWFDDYTESVCVRMRKRVGRFVHPCMRSYTDIFTLGISHGLPGRVYNNLSLLFSSRRLWKYHGHLDGREQRGYTMAQTRTLPFSFLLLLFLAWTVCVVWKRLVVYAVGPQQQSWTEPMLAKELKHRASRSASWKIVPRAFAWTPCLTRKNNASESV